MTEETQNTTQQLADCIPPKSSPEVPHTSTNGTVPKSSPEVPHLTDETWELLQYRIWANFRTKLWSLVGIFLTITTLAGILGVRAYIDGIVAKKLEAERAAFKADREKFEKQSGVVILRARLSIFLLNKLNRDMQVFSAAIRASRNESSALPLEHGRSKATQDALLKQIDLLAGFEVDAKGYPAFVRGLSNLLLNVGITVGAPGRKDSDSRKLEKEDWEGFEKLCREKKLGTLSLLVKLYPHIKSFQAAIDESQYSLVKESFADGIGKAMLYEEYEKTPALGYQKTWKEYDMPFSFQASSGEFGWENLPAYGKDAFLLEELKTRGDAAPIF